MPLSPFFTKPDSQINQETSIDPLGLLSIWTEFGQRIFGNKLTTVATDIRTFTFNVFHHYTIKCLFEEIKGLEDIKRRYPDFKDELDIKTGLLIFLEDFVAHSFYIKEGKSEGVDTTGILGITKVRGIHSRAGDDYSKILLRAHKREGVLTNQLNLGMTGRYKGPLMEMKFFNRSFDYILSNPETQPWSLVENFMNKEWKEAKELSVLLRNLIITDLFKSKSKSHPSLSLFHLTTEKDWKRAMNAYLKIFGERKVNEVINSFWKKLLGLNEGATEALYKQMPWKEGYRARNILEGAKLVCNSDDQKQLIQDILNLEPFLTNCEYLLRFLADPKVTTIDSVKKEIEIIRDHINKTNPPIDRDIKGLRKLHSVMINDQPNSEWVRSFVKFHSDIMEERGGQSWIQILDDGRIRKVFGTSLNEDFNNPSKFLKSGYWYREYYLPTLNSIYQILN